MQLTNKFKQQNCGSNKFRRGGREDETDARAEHQTHWRGASNEWMMESGFQMQCRASNPLARRIERWSPKTCVCRPARKTRRTEVEAPGRRIQNNQWKALKGRPKIGHAAAYESQSNPDPGAPLACDNESWFNLHGLAGEMGGSIQIHPCNALLVLKHHLQTSLTTAHRAIFLCWMCLADHHAVASKAAASNCCQCHNGYHKDWLDLYFTCSICPAPSTRMMLKIGDGIEGVPTRCFFVLFVLT